MNKQPIRARMHLGIILFASIATTLVVGGLLLGGLALVILAPTEGKIAGGVMIPVGLLLGYLASWNNLWIELDGDVIRERRLFTGLLVERSLGDLKRIDPLISGLSGATNVVMDALLGTTNRGYLLRFHKGSNIGLVRGDVVGVDPFMAELKNQLGPRWDELLPPAKKRK